MRLSAVLLALLLLGARTAAAQSVDEKFKICSFDFASCVPLTDAAAQARGLSADEKGSSKSYGSSQRRQARH